MKKYILLLLCLIAFSCSTSETNSNNETNQGFNIADDKYPSIVGNYINYLNNKDIEGIKSLVTDEIQVSSSNGNFTNGIVELEDNLKNLSLQTALLEACDWDEAHLEEFSSHLSMALNFVTAECESFDAALVMLKEILELNGWTNGQYDIIVKIIAMQEEEIKSFMMLEEQ